MMLLQMKSHKIGPKSQPRMITAFVKNQFGNLASVAKKTTLTDKNKLRSAQQNDVQDDFTFL